jgi:hypothetical protein
VFIDTQLGPALCSTHCAASLLSLPTAYYFLQQFTSQSCFDVCNNGVIRENLCYRGLSLCGSTVFLYQFYIRNCERRGKHKGGKTDDINIILLSRSELGTVISSGGTLRSVWRYSIA